MCNVRGKLMYSFLMFGEVIYGQVDQKSSHLVNQSGDGQGKIT